VDSRTSDAFYKATSRLIWTVFVGWIILVCHNLKVGGFINRFLSLSGWQPFAKMSLSIYLIHYVYILITIADTKQKMVFDFSWLIHIHAGDILVSFVLATGLYLFIEAPAMAVDKFFCKSSENK